jgi:hypothetical protein
VNWSNSKILWVVGAIAAFAWGYSSKLSSQSVINPTNEQLLEASVTSTNTDKSSKIRLLVETQNCFRCNVIEANFQTAD